MPNLDLIWSDNPDGTLLTGQTRTNSEGKATIRMHTRQSGDAVLQVSVNGKNKVSAPQVTMEHSRASYSHPMTAEKLNAILGKSHHFLIQFLHPGKEAASFVFPAASESNKGAKIEIWSAGYPGVVVWIGSLKYTQRYEAAQYISDGTSWHRVR